MISTAEISFYPLQEEYKPLIKEFIAKLQSYSGLRVTPGSTSTYAVGDYDRLMECMTEIMAWSHEEQGKGVFVVKFLPGYEAKQQDLVEGFTTLWKLFRMSCGI